MSTYTQLDQSIMEAIRTDKHPLYAKAVCAEARRIAQATGRDEVRVIDGRLQALRKAGVIVSNRKADAGWVIILCEA